MAGFATVALILVGASAYAAFTLNVTAPFTATDSSTSTSSSSTAPATSAFISNAFVNSVACSVAGDGQSATCPGTVLNVGSSTTLAITVENSGTAMISPSVNPLSSNSTAFSIVAFGSNPTAITAGSSAVYNFNVTALASGTSNISVGIAE